MMSSLMGDAKEYFRLEQADGEEKLGRRRKLFG